MRHTTISVTALGDSRGFADLTEELIRAVKDSGVTDGCAVAYCTHTTATLVVNEWEDGALADVRAKLDQLVPSNTYYAHDDFGRRTQNLEEGHERQNGRAHVAQMLLGGSSHAFPVAGGKPMLGRWQRLILVELDENRDREILFHVFG